MKYLLPCLIGIVLSSCYTLKSLPDSGLSPGYYQCRQPDKTYTKVYLDTKEDSLIIIPIDKAGSSLSPIKSINDQTFLKRSFDVDALTVPFKFRPTAFNFPQQLTTDFNGNIYFGYRLDRYKTRIAQTPSGTIKKLQHRAITLGGFAGLGTTFISPWTTNYRTTDEYNAPILTRGVSLMAGVNNLTVGMGVGWDYLTGRDKDIWIYQDNAWYGLTISLNIN